jgi:hypothetical protein
MLSYARFARFGEQIERYLALFPREQLLIRRYALFRSDPARLIREILEFIGADPGFTPDMSRRLNSGGVPRHAALQDFIMKPNRITGAAAAVLPLRARRAIRDRVAAFNLRRDESMPAEARAILCERLADDVERLARLLGPEFDFRSIIEPGRAG